MKELIINEADRIVDFIVNKAKDQNKKLTRTKFFNSTTGSWNNVSYDFDDIGDYMCQVVWYGTLFGKEEIKNWAIDEIKTWNLRYKTKKGFYVYSEKVSDFNVISTYNYQDGILGLRMLYALTGDNIFLSSLESLTNSLHKYAKTSKGHLRGNFIPALNIPALILKGSIKKSLSLLCSKPAVDGIIIEELCGLYYITGNHFYLNFANDLAKSWLNDKIFLEHKLFPDNVAPLINKPLITKSSVTKTNTNLLQGLISLYKINKDENLKNKIEEALNKLLIMQNKDGTFFWSYDYKKSKPYDNTVLLGNNHALISLYLEAYKTFNKKEYLQIAERCADYWLNKQDKKTGLIGNDNTNSCSLDGESDIFTEFIKLYTATNKKKYLESVKKGVSSISKYFRTDLIYAQEVNHKTGEIVKYDNEIKFLGGYLRLLIYLYLILKRKKYNENLTWELIRDR